MDWIQYVCLHWKQPMDLMKLASTSSRMRSRVKSYQHRFQQPLMLCYDQSPPPSWLFRESPFHQKQLRVGSKVNSIAWRQDQIMFTTSDNDIHIWSYLQETKRVLQGHTSTVKSAQWNPSGDQIASIGDDCTLRIWNTSTEKLVHTLQCCGNCHLLELAWSPDGTKIVHTCSNYYMIIWNASTGRRLQVHHRFGCYLAWTSPDQVVYTSNDGAILLCDINNHFIHRQRQWPMITQFQWVSFTDSKGTRHVCRHEKYLVILQADVSKAPIRLANSPDWEYMSLAWAPDGHRIAIKTNGETNRLLIYDTATGALLQKISMSLDSDTCSMCWNESGTHLALNNNGDLMLIPIIQ